MSEIVGVQPNVGGSLQMGAGVAEAASASEELRASRLFEPLFFQWLAKKLFASEHPTFVEAKYSGAQAVGCSPITAERYLKKLLSQEGPLCFKHGMKGVEVLAWKGDK